MGPREPDLPGQIKSFLESWNISVCSNEAQIGKTKVRTLFYTRPSFIWVSRTYVCMYLAAAAPALAFLSYCAMYVCMYIQRYICTYVRTYVITPPPPPTPPCSVKTFLHLCCLATAAPSLAVISYCALQTYRHTYVRTDVITFTLFNHAPSIFCLLSQSSFH